MSRLVFVGVDSWMKSTFDVCEPVFLEAWNIDAPNTYAHYGYACYNGLWGFPWLSSTQWILVMICLLVVAYHLGKKVGKKQQKR